MVDSGISNSVDAMGDAMDKAVYGPSNPVSINSIENFGENKNFQKQI